MTNIEFLKVSFDAYAKAKMEDIEFLMEHSSSYTDDGLYVEKYKKENGVWRSYYIRADDTVTDSVLQKEYDGIRLPERATPCSAGYDFYMPFDACIESHSSIRIQTGIRCRMDTGVVLMLFPQKDLSYRYGMRFAETLCVIDGAYNLNSEGHILIRLENPSEENIWLAAGDVFAQGIFFPHF